MKRFIILFTILFLYSSMGFAATKTISGDLRLYNASPKLIMTDSDQTDTDNSAEMVVNNTDTGSGTEDTDISFWQLINGTLTKWLDVDADGDIDFQNRNINTTGIVSGTFSPTGLTNNYLSKMTGSGLADSSISDDGTNVEINQNSVQPFTSVATSAVDNTLYLKAGNVGIGTTIPDALFDVTGPGTAVMLTNSKTDNTNKYAKIVTNHYDTDEENVMGLYLTSQSGSNTLYIGGGASSENSLTSINFLTGNNATTTTGSYRMTIDSQGDVGIGISNPTSPLHMYSTTGNSWIIKAHNNGNSAGVMGIRVDAGADDGSGTTYYLYAGDGDQDGVGYLANVAGTFGVTDLSSRTIKSNIAPAALSGLELINTIPVKQFNKYTIKNPTTYGFIAEEMYEIYPPMVSGTPDEPETIGVQKAQLIAPMVKAIQELSNIARTPYYNLYQFTSREDLVAMVKREVKPSQLDGCLMFCNSTTKTLELFYPATGEFKDMSGSVLSSVAPITETFEVVTEYVFDQVTGEKKLIERRRSTPKYKLKDGFYLNGQNGRYYDKYGIEVKKTSAVKLISKSVMSVQ